MDESGDPRPGLLMNLVSDNPYLQDAVRFDKGDKAAVIIQFTVAYETLVAVTVEDVAGDPVKILVVDYLPAGHHQVVWNGLDALAEPVMSGRYTFRMQVWGREEEGVIFEDTVDALLCQIDPTRNPVGVTDEEGRLVLTDARLFPHLFEREPMTAYDENGEARGSLQPTEDMIFTFADTANGGGRTFRAAVSTRSNHTFVWKDLTGLEPRSGPPAGDRPPMPPGGEPIFRLGPAFPNPFN